MLEAKTMEKTTYFAFEGHDRAKSFLFEILDNGPVGMSDLMTNFQRVKSALRTAREAANGR
jgi:hypothetical protein